MIKSIRHTGLVVSDMDKALHFWCDILGFTLSREMDEVGPYIDGILGLIGVRVHTAKLMAPDGSMLELLKFYSHHSSNCWSGQPYTTGFTHIALTVDDIESVVGKLCHAGVKLLGVPQISPDGRVKLTYVRGPEGVLIELVEELV